MTTERTAPLEIRATGKTLTGEAVRYGQRATDRPERFEAGAFAPLGPLALNLQHDRGIVLATTGDRLAVTDTEQALEVRAELQPGAALTLLRRGVLRGLSVEFRALAERTEGGVRVIERATLEALGLVDAPAYSGRLEVRRGGFGGGGRGGWGSWGSAPTMRATIPPDTRLRCECGGTAACKWATIIPEAMSEMFDNAMDRAGELIAQRRTEAEAAGAVGDLLGGQMLPGLETAAAGGDTLAVWGRYDRPLASVSRGTLRRSGKYGIEIDLPDDENGRAVLAAHEAAGVIVRPALDMNESEYTQDGDVLTYTKAVARAFVVSATDAREGWPEPTLRAAEAEPTEAEPTARSAILRRRRLWL